MCIYITFIWKCPTSEEVIQAMSGRGFSGVHQNRVYIKNQNLVYFSKGIWCPQEKVLVLFQDSENVMFTGDGLSLNSDFTKKLIYTRETSTTFPERLNPCLFKNFYSGVGYNHKIVQVCGGMKTHFCYI